MSKITAEEWSQFTQDDEYDFHASWFLSHNLPVIAFSMSVCKEDGLKEDSIVGLCHFDVDKSHFIYQVGYARDSTENSVENFFEIFKAAHIGQVKNRSFSKVIGRVWVDNLIFHCVSDAASMLNTLDAEKFKREPITLANETFNYFATTEAKRESRIINDFGKAWFEKLPDIVEDVIHSRGHWIKHQEESSQEVDDDVKNYLSKFTNTKTINMGEFS